MATLTHTSLTQVLNEIRLVNKPGAALWVVAIAGLTSLIVLLTIAVKAFTSMASGVRRDNSAILIPVPKSIWHTRIQMTTETVTRQEMAEALK